VETPPLSSHSTLPYPGPGELRPGEPRDLPGHHPGATTRRINKSGLLGTTLFGKPIDKLRANGLERSNTAVRVGRAFAGRVLGDDGWRGL
jgi:hypothetical protein